ncbi:hypothetical protein HPB52_002249 [Rhipicephalus sanguineus]|uniref:Tc1-like transposase DDE domain-containing protein n=1 Tax=Rhipicephalus sanguineus TaxID=34632 RepID=A0A9D4QBQ8_RHISA|nr:hypothetical protein HPB52_002249 [Rhipicephalus sanguineus]
MPGVTISTSTVHRLLDAHSYSVKLVTQRPADHNRDDVKHSRKLYAQWLHEEPNTETVFIFDSAPAHARAEQAALANSMHSIKRLPAYSPFFNPIEEMFSKFKSHVNAYLSERPDLVLAAPQDMTKKEHRHCLLLDAARHSMQQIQRVDCAAFDQRNFSFVPAALREDDL